MLLLLHQTTWQKIANSQWNSLVVFLVSFVPLLLLAAAVEALGMWKLGASVNDFGRTIKITQQQAIEFQVIQIGLSLLVLFFGTKLVQWVCDGFHSPATFKQAFTLTAYGITPLLWLRLVDGLPAVPTWVCLAVGGVGIVVVLYHGIAMVLQPDTSVGFGLYLICSVVLVLLAGLSHFVLQIIAQRKLSFASLISDATVSVGTLL